MVKIAVAEDEEEQKIPPIKLIEKKSVGKVYMRRKGCVLKKTMELATLCGISACTVCFGPNGEVDTWPENPAEVRAVIKKYREYEGKNGKGKRVIHEPTDGLAENSTMISTSKKDGDDLKKVLLGWDDTWLDGLSAESLKIFSRLLEYRLEDINTRIEFLIKINKQKNNEVGSKEISSLPSSSFDLHNGMDNFEMVAEPVQANNFSTANELTYYQHQQPVLQNNIIPAVNGPLNWYADPPYSLFDLRNGMVNFEWVTGPLQANNFSTANELTYYQHQQPVLQSNIIPAVNGPLNWYADPPHSLFDLRNGMDNFERVTGTLQANNFSTVNELTNYQHVQLLLQNNIDPAVNKPLNWYTEAPLDCHGDGAPVSGDGGDYNNPMKAMGY